MISEKTLEAASVAASFILARADMLVALTNVRLRVRSGHHKITPQCPLLALSGHQLASALQMSALGAKRT